MFAKINELNPEELKIEILKSISQSDFERNWAGISGT